jgi:hypothetical protein
MDIKWWPFQLVGQILEDFLNSLHKFVRRIF